MRTSAVAGRSGSQFYGDDVRVSGAAATFAADVTNPGLAPLPPDVQAVRFAGRLDAAPGSSPDVTVTAPGDVTFGGPVGGLAPLGSLDVTGVGDLAFNGGGTTFVNGGSVTTAGRQRYAQRTVLAGDTTFTAGGDVLFDNRLDAAAAGKAAADVRTPGLTRFRGEVGLTNALSSVTTDAPGSVEFAGALVQTSGGQTFNDKAVVSVGTEFRSLGTGAVLFGKTLDGPGAVVVTTAGQTTFQGAVGGTTPPQRVQAGPGPVAVNGGLVRAAPAFGAVRFTGPVTVAADTTFAATSDIGGGFQGVFFDTTLTGPGKAVVVNTGATTFFGGDVTVGSLTTDGQGASRIATANVTATGAIDFGDEVSGDASTLTVTGGSVLFRRLLNGPNTDVTIKSAGSTKFGSTVLVKSLTTDAPGTTTVSGRSEVFTSGSQLFGDPVAVAGDNTSTAVFRSTGAGRIDGDGAQSHAHLLEGGGGGGSGRGTRTPPARHATGWVERVAYALLLLSLGGMAVSVARLPWQASVVLTATIAVGVLWSVPVLPGCATDPAGARTVRLRKFKDVPLLKGPLLSVVLTVSLAGVPIAAHLYAGSGDRDFRVTPPFRSVWTVVLMEYLFLLTNAVLYDVRDVVEDGRNGVPTWPVRLGVRPTCVTLAVVNLLMGVVWMAVEANWLALVSALILAAFAAMARPTRPTLYYIALEMVDFLILLLLVIYWAADARRNPFS